MFGGIPPEQQVQNQNEAAVERNRTAESFVFLLLLLLPVVPGPCCPVKRSLQTRVLARSHGKGKLINYLSFSSSLQPVITPLTSLPARLIPPYLPMSLIFHGSLLTTLLPSQPSSPLLHRLFLSSFSSVSSSVFLLLLLHHSPHPPLLSSPLLFPVLTLKRL